MGAGASTTNLSDTTQDALQGLPQASNADYSMLANTMLPASQATAATKESAVRLKMALSTKDGWEELKSIFTAFRTNLDDAVSTDEWSSIVYQDEALRNKYFGDASPEEIAAQFDHMDEKCAQHATSVRAARPPRALRAPLTCCIRCSRLLAAANRSSCGRNSSTVRSAWARP